MKFVHHNRAVEGEDLDITNDATEVWEHLTISKDMFFIAPLNISGIPSGVVVFSADVEKNREKLRGLMQLSPSETHKVVVPQFVFNCGPGSVKDFPNTWVAVVEDIAAQLACDEVHIWAETVVEDDDSLCLWFSLVGHHNYPKAELQQ